MKPQKRPVNLNIFTIRMPIPAIASILHRISGIVLFLAIPYLLWILAQSLSSESNFLALHDDLSAPLPKLILFMIAAPFIYHFIAGIRHLLMDINIGVELKSGRMTAIITILLALVLTIMAGFYIW